MSILNIRPASRAGAHLLIQCFGGPRSGKTRTALRLARGIAGPAGKIGVLDTESGRARFYSDKIAGGFFVGDLTPPYTPKRYRDAIEEFVQFGVDVLVIDSFSHVWQGVGGVLELADQAEADGKKGLQKWLKPKTEYRKLVNFLLSTSIHIIFCSRAKQPVVEGTDARGNKTLITMPWEPIQDKTLKYEMTVVLPMTLDGGYETDPMRLKAPDDLVPLFAGSLLTEETGAEIARWVAGGEPVNHAHELLRKHASDAAADGSEAFRVFWKGIGKDQREALRASLTNMQSIAEESDAAQERAREIARENAERDDPNLDDPFGGKGIVHAGGATEQEGAFGLPPPQQTNSPAGQPTEREDANGLGGPAPAGDTATTHTPFPAPWPTDLLGDPPAENLMIPLPRQPSAGDLDYFGRQMLAMIAERPGDRARLARIRATNEDGMLKLKAGAVGLYDAVQVALTAKG